MHFSGKAVAAVLGAVLIGSFVADDEVPTARSTAAPAPDVVATQPSSAVPEAVPPPPADVVTPAGAPLLMPAGDGDGDSWHDTAGTEYRLGLVNSPESNECFGAEATAERKRLTSGGFYADVYATDTYGRGVAVVSLADGTNLNVLLARRGLANDKYLESFRSENPALGTELDAAFAAAKNARSGLWGACSAKAPPPATAAPPPAAAAPAATGSCHPAYRPCVPVKGDGSGRGQENDLDCGQIGTRVQVRTVGVDPYRLDADADGDGCESH